jgi:Ca2+-binding EF-hand superfamily protein
MGGVSSLSLFMGGPTSNADMSAKDFERYKTETKLGDRELVALAARYKDLTGSDDLTGCGTMTEKEFLEKMKITNQKVGHIMYESIDTNHDHQIEFSEFLTGISTFLPTTSFDKKVRAVFRAVDIDNSDQISSDELKEIVQASIDDNSLLELDLEDIDEMISGLMEQYGKGGQISMAGFMRLARDAPAFLQNFEFDMQEILR